MHSFRGLRQQKLIMNIMKTKQKKVLALTGERNFKDRAIYKNNKGKENLMKTKNTLCRKTFVQLKADSRWSAELVEKTRIEDRCYIETSKLISKNQSRWTYYETEDNLNKVGKYYNTSLPLIPDVRSLKIQEKPYDFYLSLFKIFTRKSAKGGNKIILRGGPNGRANRYLKYQYSRLLPLVGAFLVLNKEQTAINEYSWCYNAIKGKLNHAPFIDIWFMNSSRLAFKDNLYKYPPKELEKKTKANSIKTKPVEIISVNTLVSSNKEAIEWLLSSEGSEFIQKNNLEGRKWNTQLVLRFSVKFYYPNSKVLKSFSNKQYKKQIKKFFMIKGNLMTSSNDFLVSLINMLWTTERVFSERNFNDLKLWVKGYHKLVSQWSQNPLIKRLWIDSNGKWRPLGVSPRKWRLVIKADQVFLDIFVRGSIDPTQHGYITGKGCHTAWKEIFEKNVLKYRNIFEYDFRGFFNNVNLKSLGELLYKMKMPKQEIGRILNLVGCKIDPPDLDQLSEVDLKTLDKYEYINLYRNDFRWKGVPQGSGISPLLSVLILITIDDKLKKYGIKSIKYADDGIFYSNSDINPIDLLQRNERLTGVEFNLEKSGWVKRYGQFLKPLKFVGLKYDYESDTLNGSTRGNPSKLREPSNLKLEMLNFIKIKNQKENLLPDTLNIEDIYEIKNNELSYGNEIINEDKIFGGICSNTLIEDEKWFYQEWKTNLNFFKEVGLLKETESYYKNKESIPMIDEMFVARNEINEIIKYLKKDYILWYGKYTSSYWLKRNIPKKVFNNRIFKALKQKQIENLKPYFVIKQNDENSEQCIICLEHEAKEIVRLFKQEAKIKDNIEIIENQNWKPNREEDYELCKWYKISSQNEYVSVLNYKNCWNKWMFNGMIARLFAGTFDLSNIQQDFGKSTESESLLGFFNRLFGIRRVGNIINQERICYANKSSISCFFLNEILKSNKLLKLFKIRDENQRSKLKVDRHWKVVYDKIIERLVSKRAGSILQTKMKMDDYVYYNYDSEDLEKDYETINKSPIIEFSGPFEKSCYSKVQIRNLKLKQDVVNILCKSHLNGELFKQVNEINKKNSYLKKRKSQFVNEIYMKVWKSIAKNGLCIQALVNQFHGEHDVFNIKKSQQDFYKRSSNSFNFNEIYSWADKYYNFRQKNIGFIKKPKGARWYDWGKKIPKKIYNKNYIKKLKKR